MSILDIRLYGDKVLRNKAEPVKKINKDIISLIESMIATMYFAKGVGLAAPQVGVSKRIIIVDAAGGENGGENRIVLINPEIVKKEGIIEEEEGCLSVPGINAKVKRAEKITVKFLNIEDKPVEIKVSQLLSRVIQHEVDHLDGVLFVDRLTFLEKILLIKKLNSIREHKKG